MAVNAPVAQVKEDVWIPTACDMCYNFCSIRVHRVDGVAVKIEGRPGEPPNFGRTCAKGNAALMTVYNPNRVTTPLIRTNPEKGIGVDPKWKAISWDEALDLLVTKLQAVKAKDPRGLIGATFDVPTSRVLRPFLAAFGSPNLTGLSAGFFCGNGMHPSSYMLTGGNDVHPDLGLCNYLLMFGTSYGFAAQSDAMGLSQLMADARQRGMKLVVVDPVYSYAASKADEWLPILPGTDAALALAVMHVLVNEVDCYDKHYLKQYTNSTYLVGPDGHYVRDEKTEKPLVWDVETGRPATYDAVDPQRAALEGSYLANGIVAKTGFQLFKEHLTSYPPERVQEITSVPAGTIRRIAQEMGQAAQIGATIRIEGHELPFRPVVACGYRGISAHKHGLMNGMSVGLINVMLGSVDVPGGLLNANGAGPTWEPAEGPDGLLVSGNRYTMRGMKPSIPRRTIRQPETLELVELFPLAVYSGTVPFVGEEYAEQLNLGYRPELLLTCRTNMMATGGDPEVVGEFFKRIPFIVAFGVNHDETTEMADLLLPDAHGLERLVVILTYSNYMNGPLPGEPWYVNIHRPVVKPMGEARYWMEVLIEVADRLGILGDFYTALNAAVGIEGPYRLDPTQKYTWEQIVDRWLKTYCGEEHGLDYLLEHGLYEVERRSVRQSYPRIFHRGRIPLYLEHFLSAGEELRAWTEERGIPWDTADYVPLVEWHACPAYSDSPPDYDLFVVNQKLPFLTFTISAENPWLTELAERNGKVYPVGINAATARRKGIADGDAIVLETPGGRKVQGVARLTEGIHPDCLSIPGITGRWVTSDQRARGKGAHFNRLIEYTTDRIDTASAALDACIKVKLSKAR